MESSANSERPIQPRPTIIVVPVMGDAKVSVEDSVKSKTIKNLSIVQAVLCGLAFIFQAFLYLINGDGRMWRFGMTYYIGSGIWCAVFFGLTAGFGILAAIRKSKGLVICLMVFSIFAALASLPYFSIALRDVIFHTYDVISVMAGFHCLISLTGGITAICLSVFSCKATCCRKSNGNNAQFNNAANLDLNQIQSLLPGQVCASAPQREEDSECSPPRYENISVKNLYQ